MKLDTLWLLIITAVVLFGIVVVPGIVLKMIGSMVLLVLVAVCGENSKNDTEQIGKMQRALDKLRSAYSELDEQAKAIVRSDLELNRIQERLDKRLSDSYTLHELGKMINATLDVDYLFAQITEPLILKIGYEKTMIFVLPPQQDTFVCASAIGFNSEQIERARQEGRDNKQLRAVFDRGTSFVVQRDEQMLPEQAALLDFFGVTGLVIVPMIKEKLEGFILVGMENPYYHVTEDDVDSLFILSNQLAQALVNARLYAELKQSHAELEQRVLDRTRELAAANDKLRQLNKMKSDFVSAVSHELRTPLTSIKGYAAILGAGRLGAVTDVQSEKLSKINKHSDELIKLVNDLLDIARIESGRIGLNIREANLLDIVRNINDLFYPQSEEKHISLVCQVPEHDVSVWVDHSQISRVFINLIGNAMKFTPERGTISVTVTLPDQDMTHVVIADTGIGISAADVDRIFDEFYRVDNAINSEKKGTGLGLSLVKKIIEAHRGRIWCESDMGKGTAFHFTLSRKQIEPAAIQAI